MSTCVYCWNRCHSGGVFVSGEDWCRDAVAPVLKTKFFPTRNFRLSENSIQSRIRSNRRVFKSGNNMATKKDGLVCCRVLQFCCRAMATCWPRCHPEAPSQEPQQAIREKHSKSICRSAGAAPPGLGPQPGPDLAWSGAPRC